MAPGRIAGQALEDADHLRQRQRHHGNRRIGNRRRNERIEQLRIRRHVEAEPERRREQAEAEFAFVHVRAIEPVGIGVLVGHEDLGQRALVHHRPAVVGHERDHGAGTALEAHVEFPLLPLDEVAGDREVRALRLRDLDRAERRTQAVARAHRGLVELLGRRVQRHDAGVNDLKHGAIVEVHDRLHTLDRSRVEVDRGILAKIHLRLDDPARLLRQAERSRRERRDEHIGELVGRRDAAQRQRVEEGRILEGEREIRHLGDREPELSVALRDQLRRRERAVNEIDDRLVALLVLAEIDGRRACDRVDPPGTPAPTSFGGSRRSMLWKIAPGCAAPPASSMLAAARISVSSSGSIGCETAAGDVEVAAPRQATRSARSARGMRKDVMDRSSSDEDVRSGTRRDGDPSLLEIIMSVKSWSERTNGCAPAGRTSARLRYSPRI